MGRLSGREWADILTAYIHTCVSALAMATIGSCSITQFRVRWRRQPWPQLTETKMKSLSACQCVHVCVVQDRGTKEFHGRQFVCSSRNLLAKLHDHKLCSRNLFTCQRGRWRFNYTVVLSLSFPLSIFLFLALCAILGKSQDGCQDSSARSKYYATNRNLRAERKKFIAIERFFSLEANEERGESLKTFGNQPSWQALTCHCCVVVRHSQRLLLLLLLFLLFLFLLLCSLL